MQEARFAYANRFCWGLIMRRYLISCVAISVFMAGTQSLRAQGDRGTLTGTVTDSSGAVVPQVKLLITNEATGPTVIRRLAVRSTPNPSPEMTPRRLPVDDDASGPPAPIKAARIQYFAVPGARNNFQLCGLRTPPLGRCAHTRFQEFPQISSPPTQA